MQDSRGVNDGRAQRRAIFTQARLGLLIRRNDWGLSTVTEVRENQDASRCARARFIWPCSSSCICLCVGVPRGSLSGERHGCLARLHPRRPGDGRRFARDNPGGKKAEARRGFPRIVRSSHSSRRAPENPSRQRVAPSGLGRRLAASLVLAQRGLARADCADHRPRVKRGAARA